MSLQVIQQAASKVLQNQTVQNRLANTPAAVYEWVSDNPGRSAMLVTNGIMIFTPAAVTGPLFTALGYGAAGPVAGTAAPWVQSILGNVGANSVFAYLQSAAMGGYGVAIVNGAVQALGVVSTGVVTACSNLTSRGTA